MPILKIQTTYATKMRIADAATTPSGVRIPCITGQVGQVGVVSRNGYRYKEDFWRKVLGRESVRSRIEKHQVIGTIEHPKDDDNYLMTDYEQASHIILKAWVDDAGNPHAVFGLLNNPKGNALKALVDVGFTPGVSTRGLGDFDQDNISKFVKDEGYEFITWDSVKDPNFQELVMDPISDSLRQTRAFRELVDMHALNDSAATDYSKERLRYLMDSAISALVSLKEELLRQPCGR